MAKSNFTLTSYGPVYVIAPEVRIPESVIEEQAINWLNYNCAKDGEEAKLTDSWVKAHTDDFNSVEELLIFIRYNMYRDNREVQELADQNVVCAELATRLQGDLPEDLVEDALYAANMRLEDMIFRQGKDVAQFAEERGITEEKLYEDNKARTLQSLREDAALEAYAAHENLTLDAEDFYAVIPGDSIDDKAYKRRQIEMDGRLEQMEAYALKTKALKLVMEDAMIKRNEHDSEWLRYGDTSQDVLNANKQFPDAFVTL